MGIQRLNVAGRDLTDHLQRILRERGYVLATGAEREICRQMKEELCYVAQNFNRALDAFETSCKMEKNYELPDGMLLTMGNEQVRTPEVLLTRRCSAASRRASTGWCSTPS